MKNNYIENQSTKSDLTYVKSLFLAICHFIFIFYSLGDILNLTQYLKNIKKIKNYVRKFRTKMIGSIRHG